jgi:hypothetical protein
MSLGAIVITRKGALNQIVYLLLRQPTTDKFSFYSDIVIDFHQGPESMALLTDQGIEDENSERLNIHRQSGFEQ